MQYFKKKAADETGISMIELLATIVLLGISLVTLASFMAQNFMAIDLNTKLEEAIFVREDIKEWLSYRAQSQDIANLNTFFFAGEKVNDSTLPRLKYLLLDESGIRRDAITGKAIFGEITRDQGIDRGKIINKVRYDLTGALLPDTLKKDDENKYKIAQYLDRQGNPTDYLVSVKRYGIVVPPRAYLKNSSYRNDQGFHLLILVYDKKTGKLLTEGTLYWVADY